MFGLNLRQRLKLKIKAARILHRMMEEEIPEEDFLPTFRERLEAETGLEFDEDQLRELIMQLVPILLDLFFMFF